jgi:hypothetical protein
VALLIDSDRHLNQIWIASRITVKRGIYS